MEDFEYEKDWDEEEDEEEEGGWGLSKEEIQKRLQQVNQTQDKREEEKEEQKKKKRGRKKGTKNKTRKEKKKRDPNAPPKSKRSKRQGLKLLLIRDYLYNEASEDKPKSTEAIMEYLKENYDIEATDRTIHTDVKRLREDANVPVIYNRHRRGYYIDERPYSPAELRLIIDCIRNAEFITEEDAATLTKKIKGLASAPDRELLSYQLEEDNKKSESGASVIENIPLLIKAIKARRKISFNRYHYVAERTTHTFLGSTEYVVSPYNLIRKANKYILEYAEDLRSGGQIHRKIDVSMLTNIQVLNTPSTYREFGSQPGQQTMDEALDWFFGKKRAITIRFRYEVIGEVISRLGKDAILIDVDDYHFQTTIVDRATPDLLSWITGFGCKAKVLRPADIIDKVIRREKMLLYDYELLYKQDLEPISVLTDEELSDLSDEQNRILMYNEMELFPPEYTDEGEK